MSLAVSIQNSGGASLDLHTIAVATAYFGAALGIAMVVPQIVRTYRNRSLPGVSISTWALTALSSLTWLLYGISADEIPQIPGNVFIVSGAVIVVLAVPSNVIIPIRAAGLIAAALALVGLTAVLPATVIGFLGFGIGLISAVPQTIESLARPAELASGVSVMAWVLRAASQVCWLFYAIVIDDLVVTISATVIMASALLLVFSELRRRPSDNQATTRHLVEASATSGPDRQL